MELIPSHQRLFLALATGVISLLVFMISFSAKKFSITQSRTKRLLLKQMLESFGLDVPDELQEASSNLIESVKNS